MDILLQGIPCAQKKEQRMKKIQRIILLFVALLLWLLLMLWIMPCEEIKEFAYRSEHLASGSIRVEQGTEVTQELSPLRSFNEIILYLDKSDYSRTKRNIEIELQKAGETVERWSYTTDQLAKDTVILKLKEEQEQSGGYTLSVRTNNADSAEEGVAFRSFTDEAGQTKLCVNLYHVYTNWFAILAILVFLLTAGLWCLFRYAPVERIAPVLILGMGIVMMILMSPMAGPDERYHYLSAYKLSNVLLGAEDVEAIDVNDYDDGAYEDHYNAVRDFRRVENGWNTAYTEDAGERNISLLHSSNLRFAISYLFSALGITLGRSLHLGFVKIYYLGRLFNLLAYVGMAAAAIRKTPRLKELFLLAALLPICLQQAASYSYDMLIFGSSLLFAAWFVYLKDEQNEIYPRDIISMCIMVILFSGAKLVYATLAAMLFIILTRKTDIKKKRRIAGIIGSLVIIGMLFVIWYIQGITFPITDHYHWADALQHPFQFLQVAFATCMQNGGDWILELLGQKLAGLSVVIPSVMIFGMGLLLVLASARSRKNTVELTKLDNCVILFWSGCGALLTILAIWTDTEYGAAIVSGMQGRYFIPYLIPILLVLAQLVRLQWGADRRKLISAYFFLQAFTIASVLNQM